MSSCIHNNRPFIFSSSSSRSGLPQIVTSDLLHIDADVGLATAGQAGQAGQTLQTLGDLAESSIKSRSVHIFNTNNLLGRLTEASQWRDKWSDRVLRSLDLALDGLLRLTRQVLGALLQGGLDTFEDLVGSLEGVAQLVDFLLAEALDCAGDAASGAGGDLCDRVGGFLELGGYAFDCGGESVFDILGSLWVDAALEGVDARV